MFWVCSDAEAPQVWQCCLLLCWAENVSVGLSCSACWVQDWHHALHTLWGLTGLQTRHGQHSLNRQNQGSLVPLWKGSLQDEAWPRRSFKGAVQGTTKAALRAQVALVVTQLAAPSAEAAVQQHCMVGCGSLLPLTYSSARSWQALISRFWTEDRRKEGQTALGIRKFIQSQDVATFPNSWDFLLMVSSFIFFQ